MEQIVNGLESQLTIAVLVSGALAVLIVAAVSLAWWRGRHWVNRSRATLATARHSTLFSQADDPPPERPAAGSAAGGAEEFGSRLVREAAVRAAALRDAWDRSYREARGSAPPPPNPAAADLPTVLDDLLREQRETNALLRQLLDRLGEPEG